MRQVSQNGDMNRLTLSLQHSIVTLSQRGWSARRIARELGINRETVGKHLLAKPTTVTTGSPGDDPDSKPAIVTTGSERGRSSCEPWRSVIEAAVDRGLSAVRIHHDLIGDHGFQGCYEAVNRFVRRKTAERVAFAGLCGRSRPPTTPAMPRHKGRVEAGVKYVQDNALKGRTFTSLAEQNEFLAQWERSVADTRIHGTVRQQVLKLFMTA